MASQMTERLDQLHVAALDRGTSLMHANAVSATARWCHAETTHAQVQEFVARQIGSLEGLEDSLSVEVRQSWQWLADELEATPVPAPEPVRVFRFARRGRGAATVGARAAA